MNPIKKILWLLAGIWLLGGCTHCGEQAWILSQPTYWQIVLTDVEGCWISEYLAEGDLTDVCGGYCFRAVQRRIFKPVTLTFRYPMGRPVKVAGSHVIAKEVCKPLWLEQMERCVPPPDPCGQRRNCWYKGR